MSRRPVYSLPENRVGALCALKEHRLVVLSIATPITPTEVAPHESYTTQIREQIRLQLRSALTDVLCTFLDCAPQDINLTRTAGQPPEKNLCLSIPERQIGISISHEQVHPVQIIDAF